MKNQSEQIKSLQKNLSLLRKLFGWTMQEFGDIAGIQKQTVSNLESDPPKTEMSKIQYIALRSIFENELAERPDSDEKNNLAKVLSVVFNEEDDPIPESKQKELLDEISVVADSMALTSKSDKSNSWLMLGKIVSPIIPFVGLTIPWVASLIKQNKKK